MPTFFRKSRLRDRFLLYVNDPEFSDVEIHCHGHVLHAHKVILASTGGRICTLLRQHPNARFLQMHHLNVLDIFDVLMMIYTGRAKVAEERRNSFLSTLKELDLYSIVELIDDKEVHVDMLSVTVSLNFVYQIQKQITS